MSVEFGWQGAGIDPPVDIVEGENYFVIYQTVVGSYASLADPDDAPPGTTLEIIPHYFSSNCSSWDGPYPALYWIARFYQPDTVPNRDSSWGAIKALYH